MQYAWLLLHCFRKLFTTYAHTHFCAYPMRAVYFLRTLNMNAFLVACSLIYCRIWHRVHFRWPLVIPLVRSFSFSIRHQSSTKISKHENAAFELINNSIYSAGARCIRRQINRECALVHHKLMANSELEQIIRNKWKSNEIVIRITFADHVSACTPIECHMYRSMCSAPRWKDRGKVIANTLKRPAELSFTLELVFIA